MKKTILILVFLFIGLIGKAQNDWETWLTLNASGEITKNLKFVIEGEDRFKHKTNEIKYFHYDVGLTYKVSSKFTTGLFFREIYATKNKVSTRLQQPHIDVFWKEPIGFKFRGRLEYQMFHSMNPDLENQFRLRLRPAWQFSFWENYNPYVQSEIFFNQKYTLTRNRFSAGITMKFGKLQIQPNYTLEHNNKDIWTNRDVIWVNTKFKF